MKNISLLIVILIAFMTLIFADGQLINPQPNGGNSIINDSNANLSSLLISNNLTVIGNINTTGELYINGVGVSPWLYNQTIPANDYTDALSNSIAVLLLSKLDTIDQRYNETLTITNMNASWLSTYNVSYHGSLNNASYLSTYNATYAGFTSGIINDSNANLSSLLVSNNLTILSNLTVGSNAYFGNNINIINGNINLSKASASIILGDSASGGTLNFGQAGTQKITYSSGEFGFYTTQSKGFTFHNMNVTIIANLSTLGLRVLNVANFSDTIYLKNGTDPFDFNSTLTITNMNSSWLSTYNSTYDAKISYNSTFNQSLTDSLYAGIGSSGGNASWNQSYADTLYLGITDQRYNETLTITNMNSSWLSTYNVSYDGSLNNASYLSTYNLTYDGLINNASYLSTFNTSYLVNTDQRYNETLTITNMNLSWLSTYNITYDGLINNVSYLSTFNSSYYLTSNPSNFINITNGQDFNQTLTITNMNASWLSTYNVTYEGLMNNASYLSTYNISYDGSLNNASYLSTFNTSYYLNSNPSNFINITSAQDFNQTLTITNMNVSWLSTFNVSYLVNTDQRYNETSTINNMNSSWLSTFNSSYYLNSNPSNFINITSGQDFNQTLTITNMNSSWLSTYNVSYDGSLNNASYLSTYNVSYHGSLNNASYLSTYNVTYEGLINNASYLSTFNTSYLVNTDQRYNETLTITNMNLSWLSTYNITYDGLINNVSYLSTFNSSYYLTSNPSNFINITTGQDFNQTLTITNMNSSWLSTYNATYNGLVINSTTTQRFDMSNAILLYHMEDNISLMTDWSGNQYHGTVFNATVDKGIYGNAIHFDGATSKGYINVSKTINVSSFTVSFWINITNYTSAGQIINTNYTGANNQSWEIREGAADSRPLLFCLANATDSGCIASSPSLAQNIWYHIVLTYDNNTGVNRFYQNGFFTGQGTNRSGITLNATATTNIGRNVAGNSWFNGSLDEMAIFNRVLTDSEIQGIYFSRTPLEKYSALTSGNITFNGLNSSGEIYINGTGVSQFLYNQTIISDAYTDLLNVSVTSRLLNKLDLTDQRYNETLTITNMNLSWLSTFNTSYAGSLNNISYLSTYNITYEGLMNNASYLSTYNSTYDSIAKNGIINDSNANLSSLKIANNLTVAGNISGATGKFDFLGTITTRISKMWITDIDATNINVSGYINNTGNISLENDAVITRSNTNSTLGINSGGRIIFH